MKRAKVLFVTGTGTDVGKTYISALILKKLIEAGENAAYFKAAASGNERGADGELAPGDALFVKNMSNSPQPTPEMCPYVFEKAYSPHLASRVEGRAVEFLHILERFDDMRTRYDYLVAEGAGGVLCPLSVRGRDIFTISDFIKARDIPCLLVADAGLGAINSTVMSAFYMKERGISLKGVAFNRFIKGDVMREDNLLMCRRMTGVKLYFCVGNGDENLDATAAALEALFE